MADSEQRARAEARRARVVLRKSRLQATEEDLNPIYGAEAVALACRLAREAWSHSGLEDPIYSRAATPCATKDLDLLVRATPANAARVYRALAAFGAPLSAFAVVEADFARYDGVLQIGVPPRRIDVLNRADGISFDDAIQAGEAFELEERRARHTPHPRAPGAEPTAARQAAARRARDRARVHRRDGLRDRAAPSCSEAPKTLLTPLPEGFSVFMR